MARQGRWHLPAATLLLVPALVAVPTDAPAQVDNGVIRLAAPSEPVEDALPEEEVEITEPREGFDYGSFESRLESLWFQRKTFLADGRVEDANLQLERIRSFTGEEGVHRLEHLAGALLAEARRSMREGNREAQLDRLKQYKAGDIEQVIRELRAPTLLMWGEANTTAKYEQADEFQHLLENVETLQFISYPGVGHMAVQEAGEGTGQDVRAFLDAQRVSDS